MHCLKKRLRLRNFLLILTALPTLFHHALAQPYAGKMGINFDMRASYVNLADQDYRWAKITGVPGSYTYTTVTSSDVDPATGWPNVDCRFVTDSRSPVEWIEGVNDPDGYRINQAGTYSGSFIGQADLAILDGPSSLTNISFNSSTNTTTFSLIMPQPGPDHGLIILAFYNTKRTPTSAVNTGIRNFRLIRPGYPLNTTKIYTDNILSTLRSANFSVVRFMDVAKTNDNAIYAPNAVEIGWGQRKLGTHASLGSRMPPLGVLQGMRYEEQIAICNAADMDYWVNVPVTASNDYITQLATLIKNTLEPDRKIYVEYSNELWNPLFNQNQWLRNKATQEVAAGNSILDYDNRTDQYRDTYWAQRLQARRTKEIAEIFKGVFGNSSLNNRVRVTLAGSQVNSGSQTIGRLDSQLKFLKDFFPATPPKEYIYATSSGLYFSNKITTGDTAKLADPVQRQVILTATVARINQEFRIAADANKSKRQEFITLAKSYSLIGGHTAYEGGGVIQNGYSGGANIGNRIRTLRTEEYASTLAYNYSTNFWDLDPAAGLAMHFSLVQPYSRLGAFGLTDDPAIADRNYQFAKIRDLIGPLPPTSSTITFEGATSTAVSGTYVEAGYRIFENFSPDYYILGPAQGYASKVYQGQNWNRFTTIRRTDNTTFQLTSFQFGVGLDNVAGDARIEGYKADGTVVSVPYSFSSKTLQTLTLNWTDLRRVEITYRDGVNAAYGVIDNIVVTTSSGGARVAAQEVNPEADLTLYPNPASQEVRLRYQAPMANQVEVSILSGTGRTLQLSDHAVTEGANDIRIPLPQLPAGMYLLRLRDSERQRVRKLVIAH